MRNATTKWFDANKGYGFLIDSETKEEIFVHYSQLQMEGFKVLNEGDRVTFDVADCDKGVQAVNVRKVEE